MQIRSSGFIRIIRNLCAASFDFSRSGAVIGRHAASSGRYFEKEACRIRHAKFHGACHAFTVNVSKARNFV